MKTFTEAEERLATTLPGYESRPPQQAFAREVEAIFTHPDNQLTRVRDGDNSQLPLPKSLIAQAGCGTGKSLGYLIPALLSGKRTVISVTTKALQDQLAEKDLPFLEANLGVEFSWTVLKGRSNYFCMARAATADLSEVPMLPQMMAAANKEGFAGLREDFGFDIPASQWSKVCSESDDCQHLDCKRHPESCFASQARQRAKECRVVVVNHALFFTDLMLKEIGITGMLDEYQFVVFDEAHEIEEVAAQTLGSNLSEMSFNALTGLVRNWADRYGDQGTDLVMEPITKVLASASDLFEKLPVERIRVKHLNEMVEEFAGLSEALNKLLEAVNNTTIQETGDYEKATFKKQSIRNRVQSLTNRYHQVITESFEDMVRWVEIERTQRGEERKMLRTAPINIAPYLREAVFNLTPSVLVSATLAVDGSMAYIAGRLGIDNFEQIDVGTPFDFTKQARLYVPRHLPEPVRDKVPAWEAQVTEEIVDLVRASNGRALVLFTSIAHMKKTFETAKSRIPFTVMKQGDAPPKVLAARFTEDTHSVLFATRSFFTGVDFQGETCSLVIIAKMPFPVPTEPLTEARVEAIERAGGNGFADYTIPVMSLVLQQAAGRLIRHRDDIGVVAVLDPRMVTKGYGKKIVRSLPPMPLVDSFAPIETFLAEMGGGTTEKPAALAAL